MEPLETIGYNVMRYYNENNFKFAILPYIQKREFAFLVHKDFKKFARCSHRFMRGHNVTQITFLNRQLGYYKRQIPFNWYISLAKYKDGIPKTSQSIDSIEERKLISEKWKYEHEKQITQYDFIIDIDAPTHDEISFAVLSAKKLRDRLLLEEKEFFIIFSGCGFHFHIKQNSKNIVFGRFDDNNIYQEYLQIAKIYHDEISELIDLNIYDSRRVIKIPHSLSIYRHVVYICKPISKPEELSNFDIRNYSFNANGIWEFHKPYIYGKPKNSL